VINALGVSASVLGVLVALIGFWITIRNVRRSKRAADRAEEAASKALRSVRHIDTVQSLSKATTLAEEMKTLNREKEWKMLLDRLSTFRNMLIEIKGSTPGLSDDHKSRLQAAITQSQTMSNNIEGVLAGDTESANVPRMNKILSQQAEKLMDTLVTLRIDTEGQ